MINQIEEQHFGAIESNVFAYQLCNDDDPIMISGKEKAASLSAAITQDTAIQFAEWCVMNANPVFPNKSRWNLAANRYVEISTAELYQEFIKSKP